MSKTHHSYEAMNGYRSWANHTVDLTERSQNDTYNSRSHDAAIAVLFLLSILVGGLSLKLEYKAQQQLKVEQTIVIESQPVEWI